MNERPELEEVFWSRVKKTDTCWVWIGAHSGFGYGQLRHGNKMHVTHRLSYEMHFGPIPEGLIVCHRCDNPPCCRPDHLFLGTYKENSQDAAAKKRIGRHPNSRRDNRGEKHGMAKLTEAKVRKIKASKQRVVVLAERYGVATGTIYQIKQGIRWGWVK